MGTMDIKSRNSGKKIIYWLSAIRTCLIYGVVTLVTALIVLKLARYIPVFGNWPHNTLIMGYGAKTLLTLSLLLILYEIIVTRHPHYDVWLLAAFGGIVGVSAW
jgi:hypothetical protein